MLSMEVLSKLSDGIDYISLSTVATDVIGGSNHRGYLSWILKIVKLSAMASIAFADYFDSIQSHHIASLIA